MPKLLYEPPEMIFMQVFAELLTVEIVVWSENIQI